MKIPQTFVPEKNLEEKIKELKESEHEVSIEEFTKDDMKILYGDSTWLIKLETLEQAVDKIVKDTFEEKIKWKKDHENYPYTSEVYKANATVLNYEGKCITIPVFFLTDAASTKWGFLYIGRKEGICKNTSQDERVKRLAIDYFGIKI